MKKLKKHLAFFCVVLSVLMFSFKGNKGTAPPKDWNDCLQKYSSKWGEKCPDCMYDENTFQIGLKNICSEKIDLLVCVQETTKKWRNYMFYEMPPADTMIAYACNGTGKYLIWVRKAGDKEIVFPSIDEVNATYTK